MAFAHQPPPGALRQIADQISRRLPLLGPRWVSAPATVEESLSLWRVDVIAPGPAQPQDTLLWHHQIALGGIAEGYARSRPGPVDWEVLEVFASPLAPRTADAVALVERSDFDDSLVRLLVVPEHRVHALWLTPAHGAERVLVVDAPARYAVRPGVFFDYADFVSALRREPPIVGMD